MIAPRLIAFHLPQFHPIPENDAWWGKGFTEWTNVARGRPLFRGHYQPHLPADLGFYDLRLPEARQAQADLARAYGVGGFCYYHYWFGGRRLLGRPVDEILASGRPDFPFCLCWANENWTRRWLGEERDVLMAQAYSLADTAAHGALLAQVFADPRYIRVRDRPLFLIYRPSHIPDLPAHLTGFRAAVVAAGQPDPWLVGIDAHAQGQDLRASGFDFTLNFHPQLSLLPGALGNGPLDYLWRLGSNLRHRWVPSFVRYYNDATARHRMAQLRSAHSYPCVYVGWDNTARRGRRAIVIGGGDPVRYAADLQAAFRVANRLAPDNQLVFVNAWNEWAEGNHLEPDLASGRGYLEATLAVVDEDR